MTDALVPGSRRLLSIYLRDHLGGSTAGLALVRRCRQSNRGSPLEAVLAEIEEQICVDRHALQRTMRRLGVRESRLKELVGRAAAAAGRWKSNGRIIRYSPSTRVVELETLAAGVFMKRSLWLSLRSVVDDYDALDRDELDELIERATAQYRRLLTEHGRAAAVAFGRGPDASLAR